MGPDELPIVRVMSGAEVRDLEFMVETGPGHRRTLSANGRLIVDDDGRHLGAVVATRDVTDRNRAREALERSEARFRAASDGGLDMFMIFEAVRDGDDRIVDFVYADVNARATATLGRKRDDLIGHRLSHVYPHTVKSGYLAKFIDVALTRVPLEEEIEMQMPGFEGRWAWNQVVPLGDGVAVTSRDITHRKELERMKDEFLSVVSHELRTPLTSIRGALGLISSGRLAQAPAKAQRMMDLAVDNADRLIRLINDILDVERINAGKISIVRDWCDGADLARRVVETLRPVAERAGVELTIAGDQLRIFADADRVTQTLTNLLGNAIKFSPRGSRVETTAHIYRGTALFEVRDYGRGIPPHKLETIFDRFAQVDASDAREKGGTGLGLAICRGIVRQHGGRIWAELPDGGGSLFRFTIPLSTPQQVVA
jgi:signal transduction histidine kinase